MSVISKIFTTLVADGSTEVIKSPIYGRFNVHAYGAFGGGSLAVEASIDGVNFVPVGSPLTANGTLSVTLSESEHLRLTLSGATAPTLNSGII